MVRTNLFINRAARSTRSIGSQIILPPSIIKQLPLSVESPLSKLSSDENLFIQAASVYQEALKRAGYNHKLIYNNSDKYSSNNNNNKDN